MLFSDFGGCYALSALGVWLEAEEVATTEAEVAAEEAAEAQEAVAVG